jgi:NADH:ubiquinone oxidoreductase subunit 5 (subunit L)/multisubunit Na+/H+ antiporter MnhA subunit
MHVLSLLALLVQKYSGGFMQTDEKLLQAVHVQFTCFTSTVYLLY